WALRRPKSRENLTILNVAGSGESLTVEQCSKLAGTPLKRVPSATLCRAVINLMWNWGVTSVPPDAFPYLIGSYTMDTSKLRTLTGNEYDHVIQYSSEAALTDSLATIPTEVSHVEAGG